MTREEQLGALGAEWDLKEQLLAQSQGEVTRLTEAVEDISAELALSRQDNATLTTKLIAAEAEVKRLKDLYEPSRVCVFGVSAPQNTPGGDTLKTPGERVFLSPGQKPSTVAGHAYLRNALGRLVDDGTLWLSIKDQAGAWLTSLITDIYKVKPSVRLLMTANHEPFDNYDFRNATDWKRWQDLQVAFETVCEKFPKVEMVTIVEAYHVPSRTPGYFDAVLRPKQAFGADAYNAGIGSPSRYVPPAELHKELTAYVEKVKPGQGLYIGETGTGLVANTIESQVQRSQWVKANRDYMAEHGNVAMYWNSGGPGPMDTCKLPLDDLKMWLGL